MESIMSMVEKYGRVADFSKPPTKEEWILICKEFHLDVDKTLKILGY